MRPVVFAWPCAAALLGAVACGDRSGASSGAGGGGGREDDGPSDEGSCGDAVVDAGQEACDDGNDREGDGCNSDCRISGERVWCLDDFGPPGNAAPTALAVGPAGEIAVIGTTVQGEAPAAWLAVIDASGSLRWSTRVDGAAGIGVAFFPDGTLAAATHEAGASSSRIATYSSSGALTSSWLDAAGRIAPRALVAGPGGNVVAAGDRATSDEAEAWVSTFSASLALQDDASYRSPRGLGLTARGLAVDRLGTLILGADILLEPFESDAGVPLGGVAIAAMRPSGEVAWEHVFEPPPHHALLLASLAALPDGSVVATGALQIGPLSTQGWTASVSSRGVGWERIEEDDGANGYGTFVAVASGPDYFHTRATGLDGSPTTTALFGRFDARGGTLWERERSSPGRQSQALLATGSSADLSVLVAGSAAPIPAWEPVRPWLCKHAE